jgi:3-hydroxybutyrate dehydrogenase
MLDQPLATQVQHATGDQRPLTGRIALVTGSSSGIGLGIARALARAGAGVMLNGLEAPEKVAGLVQQVAEDCGSRAAYAAADLSQPSAVAALVAETAARLGPVDILVNNAGVQHVAPLEAFPPAKWDLILALNLSAVFHASRAVFAGMKQRGFGRIINIASAHGLVASPYKAAYVAAKHGIVGLTKVIALEGAEAGVTANAICPGYVWTPLVEQQIDDQAKAHGISREEVVKKVFLQKQPTGRFATVEEMGALAAFLASPAGASITGTALPVDGGWTAQ